MRFSLLLLASALCAQYVAGPYTHVSGGGAITLISHALVAGNPPGTTSAINTTGANLLVAVLGTYSVDPCTGAAVTDSKSNSWSCIQSYNGNPGNLAIWYVANPTVGTSHTFTGTGNFGFLAPLAFSNAATSSPLDVQNGIQGGSGLTQSTGIVTPSVNGEVCVVAGAQYDSSPESSFAFASPSQAITVLDSVVSVGGSNEGGADGYYVQSTAAAIHSTYTLGAGSSGVASTTIACFKP